MSWNNTNEIEWKTQNSYGGLGSLKHQKVSSAAKMSLVVSKSSFNAVELMKQYVASLN